MKTKYKFFLQKIIFLILRNFLKRKIYYSRKNIKWEIDLSEAIDLHLFLFGTFEEEISKTAFKLGLSKKNAFLISVQTLAFKHYNFRKNFPTRLFTPLNLLIMHMIK